MRSITEASAQRLMSNPDCHIMIFRTNQKQFDFDTLEWIGPELTPLPEQLRDKKNVISFIVSDAETVETLLKLRKEFAK